MNPEETMNPEEGTAKMGIPEIMERRAAKIHGKVKVLLFWNKPGSYLYRDFPMP
jgi:hypothetical protein